MKCPENDQVEARVTGFSSDNRIAFASTKDYGTVTFSLSLDVWSAPGSPQNGEVVILSGMTKFSKGWRATNARRFVLVDETTSSN